MYSDYYVAVIQEDGKAKVKHPTHLQKGDVVIRTTQVYRSGHIPDHFEKTLQEAFDAGRFLERSLIQNQSILPLDWSEPKP